MANPSDNAKCTGCKLVVPEEDMTYEDDCCNHWEGMYNKTHKKTWLCMDCGDKFWKKHQPEDCMVCKLPKRRK